jgi:serine/threonine protein kinase
MDSSANFPNLPGYEIRRLIASGGSSDVYEATDSEGHSVALKVFTLASKSGKGLSAIVEREAASLKRIKGGRVAQILEVNAAATPPFIAMEFVAGETLLETVEKQPLAGLSLQTFVEGLVAAIVDLHGAGVIHRDLKPQNVILGPEGIKVVDLGISAISENVNTSTRLNLSGTPGWLSPEQAIGAKVSPATDVFNLGLLIAYASSGSHPFGQGKPDAMIYRIVNQEPDLSLVQPQYQEIVDACLQKDPEARPSIRTLAHALEEGLAGSSFAQQGDSTVIASTTRLWGLLGEPVELATTVINSRGLNLDSFRLTRRGLGLAVGALLVLTAMVLALWNPSSGPIFASVEVDNQNPVVTDSVLRITVSGSESERIVVSNKTTKVEEKLSMNWEGRSSIRIEYLPSFAQDEPLDEVIDSGDFGGNLLVAGQPLKLVITLLPSRMKVEVEKPGLLWGLLPPTRLELASLARGNQTQYVAEQNRLYDRCLTDVVDGWNAELSPIRTLNDQYRTILTASSWYTSQWIAQADARRSMLGISDKLYEKILVAERRQPMFTQSTVAPYTPEISSSANETLLAALDVVDAYDSYARSLSVPRSWDGLYSDFFPRETAVVESAESRFGLASGRLSADIRAGARENCLSQHPDSTR